MATKFTHPNEWKHFLLMCDKQEFDDPLFDHYRNMFFSAPKVKERPIESFGKEKRIKVTKPDGTIEVHQGRNKLAERLGIQPNYISQYNGKVIKKGKLKGWRFDVMPKPIPVYALYEKDELLGIGTPEELSKEHGVTVTTLEYYLYQSSRPNTKRHVLLVDWEFPELEVEEA